MRERRRSPRWRVRTQAYIARPGHAPVRCKAINLTAQGVFLETDLPALRQHKLVELVFAVNLGSVTRLHRRKAIVAHASAHGAGLALQSRS